MKKHFRIVDKMIAENEQLKKEKDVKRWKADESQYKLLF